MIQNFLRVTKKGVIMLLLFSAVFAQEEVDRSLLPKAQDLENYSFDFSAHQLPVAYNTYGSAVQLHHKYKLIPDIPSRFGAIVLNKVREIFFLVFIFASIL
jgi:hypothetical protein